MISRKYFFLGCYFLFWIVYFAVFWSHAVIVTPTGDISSGLVNLWGDWAAHFTMATALEVRGLGISSPFLLGAKFSYPFFADYLSSLLLRAGVSFIAAFLVPSFVFSVSIVFALYLFYLKLFKKTSIAVLASIIFLCNGGLGFVYFIRDVATSPHPLRQLINPAHEYTRIDDENIKWISVVDSMIIPQRSFEVGFPLTLFGLAIIWQITTATGARRFERKNLALLALIGAALGTLPLLHMHSFIATFFILSCWSIFDVWHHRRMQLGARLLQWTAIVMGVLVTALPLLIHFVFGQVGQGFFQFYPGWLAREYNVNWLIFWIKNWGITPLMAVVGAALLLKKKPRSHALAIVLPFFLLFIAINLMLFQPFAWDNTKLLAWVSVGFSGLVAYALAWLWRRFRFSALLAFILFLVVIASGAIDLYWDIRTDLHTYVSYTASDLQLAAWVRANTPPSSIWVTGTNHNNWLFNLTGRQAVMTYPGWLWTYGYDYAPVEADLSQIFIGAAQTPELLKKYHVNYLIIGPNELRTFTVNPEYFRTRYARVKQNQDTEIFRIQ